MTLAGRNGAGKTTLLRMLSGETGIDGGELMLEKGTRVALHDQRPPRERELTLRDYVLSGCRDLVALEQDLHRLEGEMAERPDDGALLRRYSRAQSRLEHAGGWNWRVRALGPLHGLGFTDEQNSTCRLRDLLGRREAHARVRLPAPWPATRTCCCWTSPRTTSTSTSLEWLEEYPRRNSTRP